MAVRDRSRRDRASARIAQVVRQLEELASPAIRAMRGKQQFEQQRGWTTSDGITSNEARRRS
jgi:hypothetical protein